jgi:hypothetical protein
MNFQVGLVCKYQQGQRLLCTNGERVESRGTECVRDRVCTFICMNRGKEAGMAKDRQRTTFMRARCPRSMTDAAPPPARTNSARRAASMPLAEDRASTSTSSHTQRKDTYAYTVHVRQGVQFQPSPNTARATANPCTPSPPSINYSEDDGVKPTWIEQQRT